MKKFLIAHPDHTIQRALDVTLRELQYETKQARDGLEVIDLALDDPPDAIILGTGLAGLSGLDVARALRALGSTRRIPILFITNDAFDSANVQQAGLDIYDWVEQPLELARVREQITRLLETAAALPAAPAAESDHPLTAISDSVTGLYGRTYMLHRVAYEAARAARYGHPISAVLIGFRDLQSLHLEQRDTDRLLISTANLLRRTLRVVDLVGRTDAAEFLIVAPHTDASGAAAVAKRIQRSIENAGIEMNGVKLQLHVCIGIGISESASLAENLALFARAEAALDRARRDGEESIVVG